MISFNPRPWAWLPCILVVSGCAGSAKPLLPASTTREPASPGEARQQVEQLEALIAEQRVALGLPRRSSESLDGTAEPDTGESVARDEIAKIEEKEQIPTGQPVQPAPCAPRAISESARETERDRQCPESCRLARAICRAADRICTLASYLDEEDALRRCKRAQQDCSEARQATRSSCTGC